MTADQPVTIDPGVYWLAMECPECGQTQPASIELDTRLTVDSEGAQLRPRMRAKAQDHICGQLPLPAPDDAPTLDGAQ